MSEQQAEPSLTDSRRPAHGWGRLLVGVFAVFGVLVLADNIRELVNQTSPVASLNTAAALGYLLLAICVAHNGRRMRLLAWACVILELLGVFLPLLFLDGALGQPLNATIWGPTSQRTWLYLPVILPLVAALQIWLSDPLRIVTTAERIDSLADSVRKDF